MDELTNKLLNEFDRIEYIVDHKDRRYHSRYELLADIVDEIEQYYHYTDERFSLELFKTVLSCALAWEERDGDCDMLIHYAQLCVDTMSIGTS